MGSSSSKTLEERLQTEPIEEIYTSIFLQNNPTGEQDRIEFMKLNDFKKNTNSFINSVDINGSYGIHFATQDGHYEVVKRLLELGNDVNIKDDKSNTPLHFASHNGTAELAKTLIDVGANINACNSNGDTPLHHVTRCGKYKVAEMLVNAGADINITNNDGYTPEMIAKNRNRETFVALFDRVRNDYA